MLELGVRILMDYNISRKTSVTILVTVALIAGFPSAYSLKVFNNQDWVWGIGLLLSGFFFIFFVFKFGVRKFVQQILDQKKKSLLLNHSILKIIFAFMIIEFLIMCAWWFLQSVNWYPDTWWDPFQEFTVGTCLFQWLLVILIGILFNRKISDIKI
jgi:NSS family neurotransmitter:Na+ symporter